MRGRNGCNRAAIAEGQQVFTSMHEYKYNSVTEKRAYESFGTGRLDPSSLQHPGDRPCKCRSMT
jgi:hypothetical protein